MMPCLVPYFANVVIFKIDVIPVQIENIPHIQACVIGNRGDRREMVWVVLIRKRILVLFIVLAPGLPLNIASPPCAQSIITSVEGAEQADFFDLKGIEF